MIQKFLASLPFYKNDENSNKLILLLVCITIMESKEEGIKYFKSLFNSEPPKINDLKDNMLILYSKYIDKINTGSLITNNEAKEVQIKLDSAFRKYILNDKISHIYDQVSVGYCAPTHELNFNLIH